MNSFPVAVTVVAMLAVAGAATAGCADGSRSGGGLPAPDGRIRVVAAFYPLQFLAERIGGDRVSVANLVKAGVEPHDLELSPKQVAAVASADLVVHLAGFQPAVDEAVHDEARTRAFDVAGVEPLADAAPGAEEPAETGGSGLDGRGDGTGTNANEGKDPHVWLDPTRLAAIGDRLADRLAAVDGENTIGYHERAAAMRADLTALDREYAATLASCRRREIVTSHAAFGYLATRYRLVQVPISGLSPEAEPTPQRIADVAALAADRGVTTIFFETLVSPKVAETLAAEVGARAEMLDPIEGFAAGSGDYLAVMRANLGKLRTALDCT